MAVVAASASSMLPVVLLVLWVRSGEAGEGVSVGEWLGRPSGMFYCRLLAVAKEPVHGDELRAKLETMRRECVNVAFVQQKPAWSARMTSTE